MPRLAPSLTVRLTAPWAAAILLGLLAAPTQADEQPTRVLPPAASKHVLKVLSADPGTFTFQKASIEFDTVHATLCATGDDGCFDIRLEHPEAKGGCEGERVPAWCVAFAADNADNADNAPSASVRAAVLLALGTSDPEEVWGAPVGAGSDLPAVLIALALLLGPLFVGWLLGLLVRRSGVPRFGTRHRWSMVALAGGITTLAVTLVHGAAPELNVWDLLLGLILWLGALIITASRTRVRGSPRARWIALGATALGAIILELAASALTLPEWPEPATQGLTFGVDEECTLLFPDHFPRAKYLLPVAPTPTLPRVLHLGDSMTAGYNVPDGKAFPDVLNRLDPAAEHLNAGVSATSTDYQLALARTWIDRTGPSLVVLHVYTGNDMTELGKPLLCCAGRPPIDASSPTLETTCTAPSWGGSLGLQMERRPPPYALRVLGSYSHLLRALTVGLRRAAEPAPTEDPLADSQAAALARYVGQLATELAQRKIALVVDVVAPRSAVVSGQRLPEHDAVVQTLRAAGLQVLDTWGMLRQQLAQLGEDAMYLPAGDIHFTVPFHEVYARWLKRQLAARPAAPPGAP